MNEHQSQRNWNPANDSQLQHQPAANLIYPSFPTHATPSFTGATSLVPQFSLPMSFPIPMANNRFASASSAILPMLFLPQPTAMPVIYVLNPYASPNVPPPPDDPHLVNAFPRSSKEDWQPNLQRPPTSVFLGDLPSKDRRNMLAMHEDFVRTMKEQQRESEEKQKEEEKEEQEELNRMDLEASMCNDPALAAAVAVVNEARRRKYIEYQLNNSDDNMADSDSDGDGEWDIAPSSASVQSQSKKRRRVDSGSNVNEGIITLCEPRSIRLSIYEKFVRHMESFFNAQDSMGLTHMLFYPLCGNDGSYLIADHKAWRRIPINENMQLGLVNNNKRNNGAKPTELTSSDGSQLSSDTLVPFANANKFRYELIDFKHFSNLTEIGQNLDRQLLVLPDAVMVHGDTKVKHNIRGETVSITPFTFFSTILVQEHTLNTYPTIRYYCSKNGIQVPSPSVVTSDSSEQQSSQSEWGGSCSTISTPSPLRPVNSFDCVIQGYTVIHYDKDDRIIKVDSHIVIPV